MIGSPWTTSFSSFLRWWSITKSQSGVSTAKYPSDCHCSQVALCVPTSRKCVVVVVHLQPHSDCLHEMHYNCEGEIRDSFPCLNATSLSVLTHETGPKIKHQNQSYLHFSSFVWQTSSRTSKWSTFAPFGFRFHLSPSARPCVEYGWFLAGLEFHMFSNRCRKSGVETGKNIKRGASLSKLSIQSEPAINRLPTKRPNIDFSTPCLGVDGQLGQDYTVTKQDRGGMCQSTPLKARKRSTED